MVIEGPLDGRARVARDVRGGRERAGRRVRGGGRAGAARAPRGAARAAAGPAREGASVHGVRSLLASLEIALLDARHGG